jgi:hypothetical protein
MPPAKTDTRPQAQAPAPSPVTEGDELERLRRENAALRAKLSVGGPAPATDAERASLPKKRFRVRLEGVLVRYVDDKGRPQYRDYLDVEAVTEGDAWLEFKRYNGIRASVHAPRIEPTPDDEPTAAEPAKS